MDLLFGKNCKKRKNVRLNEVLSERVYNLEWYAIPKTIVLSLLCVCAYL